MLPQHLCWGVGVCWIVPAEHDNDGNNKWVYCPVWWLPSFRSWPCAVVSPEQREVEQEDGSDGREEGQDSPITCGDDMHLYDNQISPGSGQYTRKRERIFCLFSYFPSLRSSCQDCIRINNQEICSQIWCPGCTLYRDIAPRCGPDRVQNIWDFKKGPWKWITTLGIKYFQMAAFFILNLLWWACY